MRVVLDTNVIIAAFISRGVCNELLEHCVINHQVVLSDFILNETKEKLTEKFKQNSDFKIRHFLSPCRLPPILIMMNVEF